MEDILKVYEILFYRNRNGNEPLTEYLDDLRARAGTNKDARIKSNKIYEYLEILERYGTRAGEPYIKHLDSGIWELRPLRDRLLFASWYENKLVILHQFQKTTPKTPQREIDQAKRNMQDFMERMKKNE